MMKAKNIQAIICLVIFFLFADQSWAADWIYYDTADFGDTYYDKSSIKKEDKNIISVLIKNILSEEAKTKYFSILKGINKAPDNPSVLSYYTKLTEIDRLNKKNRDISVIFYDETNKVVYSSPKSETGDWNDILPNTVGEKLINMVSWETITPNETIVVPEVEEPVTSNKIAVDAPVVTDKNPSQFNNKQFETKSASGEAIRTAEEYYNYGNFYKKQGNLTQAMADYTKAIEIDSKNAKAYYNRGNIYGKQGNLTQAIVDYTKAIEIDPKYRDAYYNRGNTYRKQDNFAQAIVDYTQAIEIDPKYAAAYGNRGNVYQIQGNFQQAIIDYNKAIQINPDMAGFYSNRGNAYQIQGNFQQAIADYNKAIELNPNDDDTYYNRGLAHYGIEQYGKSLADYTNATSKNPNKEAYENFIKYVPVKKVSDTGDVRDKILHLFAEKLNLDKKIAISAPVVASVAQPIAEHTVAPKVVAAVTIPAITDNNLAQVNNKQIETKSASEDAIRNLINKWLNSWKSGDMKTYRSFYVSDFHSEVTYMNALVSYKTNVRKKSKKININIDKLKISVDENIAAAVFTQHYDSSILQYSGKKTLELKKINDEWKIYREIM
jgi:tetratricopeptide (TPR) repeat protein/ketosteroid isomerase-like protein